jgi:hypothetical protein
LNAKIIINEIMPIPAGNEPEWIELFNVGTDDILLHNFTIADGTTPKKIPDFELKKGEFAVLVKDTSLLKSIRIIPVGAILIQMTIPSLNNTTDYLTIKNSEGILSDSIYYNMKWGEKERSLERIDPNYPAINSDNWSKSNSISGATAGAVNSVIIVTYDITCSKIYMSDNYKSVSVLILDIGRQKSSKFNFDLYIDLNSDDSLSTDEKLISFQNADLNEADTIITISTDVINKSITKNGIYSFTGIISSANDGKSDNDTCRAGLYLRLEEPIIKINEIMYDVTSDKAEFIEIWNGGQDTLLMDNFLIWDAAGSLEKGNVKIISDNFKIAPDSYGIICWDSLFFNEFPEFIGNPAVYCYRTSFNLNLSSDLIVLADINGKIYDSLTYFDSWHTKSIIETKNRSLEKINESINGSNPISWATCAEIKGSTPLAKNSLSGTPTENINIEITPNPFAPNSTGNDAIAKINLNLPYSTAYLNAAIYDINGYKVAEIANNRYSSGKSSLEWDGKNSEGYIFQIGQYILLIEATDVNSGNVESKKAIIVIGN